MNKILKEKILTISTSFLLGVLITYLSIDYIQMKKSTVDLPGNPIREKPKDKIEGNKHDSLDVFPSLEGIHKQMQAKIKGLFQDSMFDDDFMNSNSFSFSNRNILKIKHYEGSRFKYIDVSAEGLKPHEINIEITGGIVRISGEIKREEIIENEVLRSRKNYMSKFSQSFDVPSGVDENKAQIIKKKNMLTIKFPINRD